MAAPNYNLISEIVSNTQDAYTLKTRVSRKWHTFATNSNKVVSLDMLLMDETGAQIHVKATSLSAISRLDKEVLENEVYFVSKFSTMIATAKIRPVSSRYIVFLREKCSFRPVVHDIADFPRAQYSFIPYSALAAQDMEIMADAIGILTEWPQTKMSSGRIPSEIREITMVNESGERLSVTLWGDFRNIFSEETLRSKALTKPIVVLSLGKISNYYGIKMSTTSATRILLDPNIPEATSLKNSNIAVPLTIGGNTKGTKTLSDVLKSVRGETDESYFACTATVTKVFANNEDWCYLACKECKSKVEEILQQYQCKNHGVVDDTYMLCKLQMQITDDSGDSIMIAAFGDGGEALLQHSVMEILAFKEKGEDITQNYIYTIEGTIATFNIRVTPTNRKFPNGYLSVPTLTIEKRPTEIERNASNKKMDLATTSKGKHLLEPIVDVDQISESSILTKKICIKQEPED